MKKLIILIALTSITTVFAQTKSADIMYKKEVTRAVDLREKQNKSIFARGHEITDVILQALNAGKIQAYTNDSLTTKKNSKEVMKSLIIPSTQAPVDTTYMDEWEREQYREQMRNYKPDTYSAKDLYQLEITEDIIFDKNHSILEYSIKSLTLYIPAGHPDNIRGIQTAIATFNYDDCKTLFANNPNAIWYNPQNEATHLNLADAFDLRMFSSYIIKVANPDDEYLMDIYGSEKGGILASQKAAMDFLEFESNLWEN